MDSTHRHTGVCWPAKTYIHQLCVDIGCHLEDLQKKKKKKKKKKKNADSAKWQNSLNFDNH